MDCNHSGRGFVFQSGEDANSVLGGLTITNGYANDGSAILIVPGGRPPTDRVTCRIMNCVIANGTAETHGGAIYCYKSAPTIMNCVFTNNSAKIGGAIYYLESNSTVSHCTFRFNSAILSSGGAVRIQESDVTIIDSLFERNSAQTSGGALTASHGSELILTDTVFTGNSVPLDLVGEVPPSGGALAASETDTIISTCLFVGNSAMCGGAARMPSWGDDLNIANCTFAGNHALWASALYIWPSGVCKLYNCDANIRVENTIIWDNLYAIVNAIPGTTTLASCDILGGESSVYDPGDLVVWTEGNIDTDPCFADAGYWDPHGTPDDANDDSWVYGDYHLKSQAGRWDPNEGRWTIDDVTSSCIDAGDRMSPIGLEVFPNGGIVNMGVYGGTAEASKSYFGKPVCETIVAGDVNGDCAIDSKEFFFVALHWLESH